MDWALFYDQGALFSGRNWYIITKSIDVLSLSSSMVECWTVNPKVGGSNPGAGTFSCELFRKITTSYSPTLYQSKTSSCLETSWYK